MSQPSAERRPDVQRARPAGPPTLATVADEAGVSRQTVSNALNNPDLLRPETLERVQAVIERLGYSPNRAARQLRTRSSHLIGLRFEPAQEGTSNALMDRFLHSLVEAASRTGHHVLLFSGDPDDPLDGYDDLLRSTAVDAFVVTDTYAGTPAGGVPAGPRRALRDLRPPLGRPRTPTTRGSTSTAPHGARARHRAPARAGPPADRLAGLGDAPPGSARTAAAAGRSACARPGQDPTGLGVRLTDNVDAARMATHHVLDDPTRHRVRLRQRHPRPRRAARLAERGLRPGADVGVVGFDDSARRAGHLARADLGAPAARGGRRRARADPAPRAGPQAGRPSRAGCSSPPSSYAAPACAAGRRSAQ